MSLELTLKTRTLINDRARPLRVNTDGPRDRLAPLEIAEKVRLTDNTLMSFQIRPVSSHPFLLVFLLMEALSAQPTDEGESIQISRVMLPVTAQERARCVSLPKDGGLIAFTSERRGGFGGNDIWLSRWKGERWTEPFNPGPAINSAKHEFDGRFSRDGDTLVFIRGEIDMWEANSSQIHISHFKNEAWSQATALPDHVSPSNTIELAATLSSDGTRLYFSSNREGGYGRYDHYYCRLTESGWSEPVNLGPDLNTEQDEIDLTLGSDGDLLIFPANLEDSIGGSHDLYFSRRIEGRWSKPRNLGPRINTPGNDTCPWLGFDGYTLYLNSDWAGILEGMKGEHLIWKIWYSRGFKSVYE